MSKGYYILLYNLKDSLYGKLEKIFSDINHIYTSDTMDQNHIKFNTHLTIASKKNLNPIPDWILNQENLSNTPIPISIWRVQVDELQKYYDLIQNKSDLMYAHRKVYIVLSVPEYKNGIELLKHIKPFKESTKIIPIFTEDLDVKDVSFLVRKMKYIYFEILKTEFNHWFMLNCKNIIEHNK